MLGSDPSMVSTARTAVSLTARSHGTAASNNMSSARQPDRPMLRLVPTPSSTSSGSATARVPRLSSLRAGELWQRYASRGRRPRAPDLDGYIFDAPADTRQSLADFEVRLGSAQRAQH
eukprot:PhM_4_TR5835/c0_g1_i1/m.57086